LTAVSVNVVALGPRVWKSVGVQPTPRHLLENIVRCIVALLVQLAVMDVLEKLSDSADGDDGAVGVVAKAVVEAGCAGAVDRARLIS